MLELKNNSLLRNRTILISGVTGGIGTILAKYFIDSGNFVVGCGTKPDPPFLSENLTYLKKNCKNPSEVEDLISKYNKKNSELPVLINCVGGSLYSRDDATGNPLPGR